MVALAFGGGATHQHSPTIKSYGKSEMLVHDVLTTPTSDVSTKETTEVELRGMWKIKREEKLKRLYSMQQHGHDMYKNLRSKKTL